MAWCCYNFLYTNSTLKGRNKEEWWSQVWRDARIISAGQCWRKGWRRGTDSLKSIYSSITFPSHPITSPTPPPRKITTVAFIAPLPICNWLLFLWQLAPHQFGGYSHEGGWGKWFGGIIWWWHWIHLLEMNDCFESEQRMHVLEWGDEVLLMCRSPQVGNSTMLTKCVSPQVKELNNILVKYWIMALGSLKFYLNETAWDIQRGNERFLNEMKFQTCQRFWSRLPRISLKQKCTLMSRQACISVSVCVCEIKWATMCVCAREHGCVQGSKPLHCTQDDTNGSAAQQLNN